MLPACTLQCAALTLIRGTLEAALMHGVKLG